MQNRPVIAITMGDPSGIGPEVITKALADPEVAGCADWIVVGDAALLPCENLPSNARMLDVGLLSRDRVPVGRISADCGRAALEYIRRAVALCMEGKAGAMATAPVNKEAASLAGEPFSGHTEFIARLSGAKESRMLLACDRLKVVHVTTHIPLRKACDVDTARVKRTIELGHEAVRLLGIARPRIAVCGLNPHAGEHGLFGEEDQQRIAPAVEWAREKGMDCEGPLAADAVFSKAVRGGFDLVVAMYHDQGHVPMKLLDFENAVNISLGLPIIRTSVDHGTAFDIAGKGVANPNSMKAALRYAASMAANRQSGSR